METNTTGTLSATAEIRMCPSAVNRLPSETWEEILDWVIDIPFFFDLGCTLDDFYDWTTKQKEVSLKTDELYACSESQRRTLRQVCRSWKAFADSRADRWSDGDQVVARSLHVSIDDITEEHYSWETRWEMVSLGWSLHPTTNEYGRPLLRLAENHENHKNIQRIHLQLYWPYSEHEYPLLKSLAAFSNLRTLRLDIDITKAPSQPVVLSQLTNLRWTSWSFGCRPHECLLLPSLTWLWEKINGQTGDRTTGLPNTGRAC